jgi:hypothetical protein
MISKILERKGLIATAMGIILGLPTEIMMVIKIIKTGSFEVLPHSIGLGFAILLLILPSSIVASFKDFKIEIKD